MIGSEGGQWRGEKSKKQFHDTQYGDKEGEGDAGGIQDELLDAKFNDSWIILGEVENKGVETVCSC